MRVNVRNKSVLNATLGIKAIRAPAGAIKETRGLFPSLRRVAAGIPVQMRGGTNFLASPIILRELRPARGSKINIFPTSGSAAEKDGRRDGEEKEDFLLVPILKF